MDEERLRVLQMLKEHKLTEEEALSLLEAIEIPPDIGETDVSPTPAKAIRIRVTDLGNDKPNLSVDIPINLITWALRSAGKLSAVTGVRLFDDVEENITEADIEQLCRLLTYGVRGKLMDVVIEDEGQHVEIIIE